MTKHLLILSTCLVSLYAQPSSYPLAAPPPPPVQSGTASVVGNTGNQTYFYIIVARYPIGNAVRSPAFQASNAPATLTASNFVRISWTGQPGATGYDVLRLITPSFPVSGICINCLIVSNTASLSFNDQSNATLGNYTLSNAPSAQTNEYLDNLTQPIPTITHDSGMPTAERWTQQVSLDASGARITKPIRVVAAIPSTCSPGEEIFLNTAPAGQQIYVCGPTPNVFTAIVGTGGGSGGVNCTPITTSGVVAVNFTTAGPLGVPCTDIVITPSGNITTFSLTGGTSRLSVTFSQGGVGFTVGGLAGNLLNWCAISAVANKYTIQNILFDGTNYNGDGCSSNDPTIVPATQGGTGFGAYTKGDLLCAQNSTTLNKLAVGTDGQALIADAASMCGVKWGGTGILTSMNGAASGTASNTSYWWAYNGLVTTASACTAFENAESLPVAGSGSISKFTATSYVTVLGTAEAVTFTLFKNCVTTGITATSSLNATNPAVAVGSGGPIAYVAGDRFQLRIDNPVMVTPYTASILWTVQ